MIYVFSSVIFVYNFFIISATFSVATTSVRERVRIVTYNTGLTTNVPHYEERRHRLAPALRDIDADLICLQEVWYSIDLEKLVEELQEHYPYSVSALHDVKGSTKKFRHSVLSPCASFRFLVSFIPCLEWYCSKRSSTVDFLTCAVDNCGFMQLSQQCITCLVMSEHSTSMAIHQCLMMQGQMTNEPGLLLLSKLPLSDTNVIRYMPDRKLLLPRSYLKAKVDGLGTAVCTHLTADLGPVYFEPLLNFSSWANQSSAEAKTLSRSFKQEERLIVMGDLNTSPQVRESTVRADLPGTLDHLLINNLSETYTRSVGICTWCRYNPLSGASENKILDHVLLRNIEVVGSRRIFDSIYPKGTCPLSDHFGIEVTLQVPDQIQASTTND